MADQIQTQYSASGANVYAIIRNADGEVWDGAAFVPYATVDLGTYDLPMTEQGTASRYYAVDMPTVAAGLYSIVAFVRAGGAPAETDTAIGAADADWDGSVFSTLEAINDSVNTLGTNVTSGFGALSTAVSTVQGAVDTVVSIVEGIVKKLFVLFRGDAAIATDMVDELTEINANYGSGVGTYDNTTDSVEAIAASGGGGLDAAGVRAAVGLASANLDTQLNALPTNAELATALGTADDAVLAAIGAAGAGLTAIPWNASWDAEVQSEVADALEATIADSIPADGTIPSVKQALYMLVQFMVERNVTGTTATIRKADGTTSLYTLTLNSATAPTNVTRAT